MEPYRKFLSKDPKLKSYLKNEIGLPPKTKNITLSLASSIISQQLSIKVAKIIFLRFVTLLPAKKQTAAEILKLTIEDMRAIGLSNQKAGYILNVANFIVENKVTLAKINKMSDDEVIDLLSQIKGVGRWTVEMLLIFGFHREDVFAVDDLGIQKAMIETFKLHDLNKKELRLKMLELSKRWSPYRTFVCLHFWNYSSTKE